MQCYTCGALMFWKESQAGHAIGGRHNAVLLDEEICRPQCVRCNVFMRGQYPIFTAKLIRENGLDWFEGKLQNARQVLKLARSDYEEMIGQYKAKLAGLEVGAPPGPGSPGGTSPHSGGIQRAGR